VDRMMAVQSRLNENFWSAFFYSGEKVVNTANSVNF